MKVSNEMYNQDQIWFTVNWANRKIVRLLYEFAKTYELPFLDRKWNNITQLEKSGREMSQDRIIEVKNMKSKNIRNTDIAKQLGIGKSAVTLICKRNNIQ